MNRRDFSKLSTLAAASTQLPRALAQVAAAAAQKPVGYAIVGLGNISTTFMEACANSSKVKIAALVTGHPETKGVKFSEMYGVPKSSIYTYETYDKLRENKDVEAIYIGLPNSMHREYTVRGAQAGKHILCEKPMAISSAECRAMVDACRAAKVKLMIAYRLQYDPTWQKARDLVHAGAIGKVQSYRGNFLQSQTPGVWRLTRQYGGGGSVLDVGIYPLNCIRYLAQEEPADFTAVLSTRDRDDPRFKEVEQSVEWTMKFPSGIIASCGSSYGQLGPAYLSIHGDQGYIVMNNAFGGGGIHLTGKAGDKSFDELGTGTGHFQFALEGDHFADCIRNNTEPRSAGEEGLADMVAIERIYKAAGASIA
jgi:predicted dehydrogenase